MNIESRKLIDNRVNAYLKTGNVAEAIFSLKAALRADPMFYKGWQWLSQLLYQEKNYPEAVQVLQTAERFDPLTADFQSIQFSMQQGDLHEAERVARKMLNAYPGHPRAIFTLAHLSELSGDHETRVHVLELGLDVGPANLTLRRLLIGALEAAGAYSKAIKMARHLTNIQKSFETLWLLLILLLRYGQSQEALEVSHSAEIYCDADPQKLSEVYLVRGQVLRILGNIKESISAFQLSLEHNPFNAASWWGLSDFKTITFSATDEASMRQLLVSKKLDKSQTSLVAFALAKKQEMNGRIDEAMDLYQRANDMIAPSTYNITRVARAAEKLTHSFDNQALVEQAGPRVEAAKPIFILGLPRSGSTLVEQILASHPEVEATIELPVLPSIKRKAHLRCKELLKRDYLDGIGQISELELTSLGNSYLFESQLFRKTGCAYFIDKMPYNFEHIGLIHKILPDSIIIDVRRNPLDCGLSIYKQNFTQGSPYSYDLKHIGAYYNIYLSIMDHWDNVLPGRVLHVQYENIVRKTEEEIRRILAFINLPFHEACVTFHETNRAIRTASSEQVRQPIYKKSIGVWQKYEDYLSPLRESLGEKTISRFQCHLT